MYIFPAGISHKLVQLLSIIIISSCEHGCNAQSEVPNFSTYGATTPENQPPFDEAVANADPKSSIIVTADQSPEDSAVKVVAWSEEEDSLRFEFEKSDCTIKFRPVISVVTTDKLGNSSEITESKINLMNKGVMKQVTGFCNGNDIYLRGQFSQKKQVLKSGNPTAELVDEIVTDDRKCVAPNQCDFELTFRKIKRVYGRITIEFWGLANSTLTITKPSMYVDLVSERFYDFPVGMVLICNSEITLEYGKYPESANTTTNYNMALSNMVITPKNARTMDSRKNMDEEKTDEIVKDTEHQCALDRRRADPGKAPFVMGILVAGCATVGLIAISWKKTSTYEAIR